MFNYISHIVCMDCGHEWENENTVQFYEIYDYDPLLCPSCGSDNLDDDSEDMPGF